MEGQNNQICPKCGTPFPTGDKYGCIPEDQIRHCYFCGAKISYGHRNGMSLKEFAKMLDSHCRRYGSCLIENKFALKAKSNGFVVVYVTGNGYIEFFGALSDEEELYGDTLFNKYGIFRIPNFCDDCDCCEYVLSDIVKCKRIDVCRCNQRDGNVIPFKLTTRHIPHETFMIYAYGKPYCEGIVFKMDDIE